MFVWLNASEGNYGKVFGRLVDLKVRDVAYIVYDT